MRTEGLIFSVRIIFAYYKGVVFYTHGHPVKSFVTPKFCPTFAMSKGREDIEKLNGNDSFHSAY